MLRCPVAAPVLACLLACAPVPAQSLPCRQQLWSCTSFAAAGKLLDWLLGEESALFRRQELAALVGLHAETQQDGSGGWAGRWEGAGGAGWACAAGCALRSRCAPVHTAWKRAPVPGWLAVGALTSDEVQVIQGALDMAGKTAESVMTPLGKVRAAPRPQPAGRASPTRRAPPHGRLVASLPDMAALPGWPALHDMAALPGWLAGG